MLVCEDQGRSFHLFSRSQPSNHWIAGRNFTSFSKYRFAIRGWLSLLLVKMVVQRAGKNVDTTCPKCHSQPESLDHVSNTCSPNQLMREKHNRILRMLVEVISKEGRDVVVERSFSPDGLRPDVVVRDQVMKQTTIVDVVIPYEARVDASSKARVEKVQKYERLRVWMEGQQEYQNASIHAFVVGSLGGWDDNNASAAPAACGQEVHFTIQKAVHGGCHQRLSGDLEKSTVTHDINFNSL